MSRKSSLNVAKLLSAVDWSRNGKCVHCTFTYHRTWPQDRAELVRHKQKLSMAFARNSEAALWRLEYQTRKKPTEHRVPHWHVLAWLGGRDEGQFVEWVRTWWASCSGNRSPYASDVRCGDQARAGWYLAMHAAKREQSPAFQVGRWWGLVNRPGFFRALDVQERGEISEAERVWWARLYRRATGGRTRTAAGFSWFLPLNAQAVLGCWVRDQAERKREATAPAPF